MTTTNNNTTLATVAGLRIELDVAQFDKHFLRFVGGDSPFLELDPEHLLAMADIISGWARRERGRREAIAKQHRGRK